VNTAVSNPAWERDAVAAMLLNRSARATGASLLTSECFSVPEYRAIYSLLVQWQAEYPDLPPDPPAIARELNGQATLLAELLDADPGPLAVHPDRIAGLRDLAARRYASRALRDLADSIVYDETDPISEINSVRERVVSMRAPAPSLPYETADALMARSPQAPPHVVADILPAGGVGLLVGEPGAGKTWLAFQLARAVADGSDFLGLATTRGRAGMVLLETPDWAAYARLCALDPGPWTAAISIITAQALGSSSLDIIDPATHASIVAWARDQDLALLVLDPLAYFHALDENKTQDAVAIARALKDLALLTGCAILVLHHPRKSSTQAGPGKDSDIDAARGAGALVGAVQTILRLSKKHGTLCLVCPKSQTGRRADPIFLAQSDSGPLVLTDPPPGDSEAAEKRRNAVLDLLRSEPQGWGSDAILAALSTQGITVSRVTVGKYLASLMASQQVVREGVRGAFSYRFSPKPT
jgi:hypothetical protein